MSDTGAPARRVQRLRELMAERGYDAVILRNNPDLRWLTGCQGVFDFEVAHTAFVTANGLWLHTDSRYLNSFVEAMGEERAWELDMDLETDLHAFTSGLLASNERCHLSAMSNRTSSFQWSAVNMSPMGMPSEYPHGTDRWGMPVRFGGTVRKSALYTSSADI